MYVYIRIYVLLKEYIHLYFLYEIDRIVQILLTLCIENTIMLQFLFFISSRKFYLRALSPRGNLN